jgi:hypothetical protein
MYVEPRGRNAMPSSDETPTGSGQGEQLRADLERVEVERADLLRSARDLRGQLSDAGPVDAGDRTAIIRQAEELEALAAELGRRQEALSEKVAKSP